MKAEHAVRALLGTSPTYSSGFLLSVSSAGDQLELLLGGFLLIHFPIWPTTFLSSELFIFLLFFTWLFHVNLAQTEIVNLLVIVN